MEALGVFVAVAFVAVLGGLVVLLWAVVSMFLDLPSRKAAVLLYALAAFCLLGVIAHVVGPDASHSKRLIWEIPLAAAFVYAAVGRWHWRRATKKRDDLLRLD